MKISDLKSGQFIRAEDNAVYLVRRVHDNTVEIQVLGPREIVGRDSELIKGAKPSQSPVARKGKR